MIPMNCAGLFSSVRRQSRSVRVGAAFGVDCGEDFLRDGEGGVGVRYAGVHGRVQEHLADLLAGEPVVQRSADVQSQFAFVTEGQ